MGFVYSLQPSAVSFTSNLSFRFEAGRRPAAHARG